MQLVHKKVVHKKGKERQQEKKDEHEHEDKDNQSKHGESSGLNSLGVIQGVHKRIGRLHMIVRECGPDNGRKQYNIMT